MASILLLPKQRGKNNMEKYVRPWHLQSYQCDRDGYVRPVVLMNELQGMSDTHAELIGCGRTFLMENKLAWVVTHYLVDIVDIPREGTELVLSTWPSAHLGLRAIRDFEVREKSTNKLMVRATSQWILIDIETRRPVRINDRLPHWECLPTRAWDCEFEKFADFDAEKFHMFKCRFDDIDVNQHINNAVYAIWATESVGFQYRSTHHLRRLEMNFKKEINPNTPEISVGVRIDGDISYHKIMTGDIEHATVICTWDKNTGC